MAFPRIGMEGCAQPQRHLSWAGSPPTPMLPTVFPGAPEILISLNILSTKNFLLQLLGGKGGTDCSKFSCGLLVFSAGRAGSGGGVGRRDKGEKRREKTGAVSNEVVGHDLTNSTALKSIDPPPAQPRTACTLPLPALQARHCLM